MNLKSLVAQGAAVGAIGIGTGVMTADGKTTAMSGAITRGITTSVRHGAGRHHRVRNGVAHSPTAGVRHPKPSTTGDTGCNPSGMTGSGPGGSGSLESGSRWSPSVNRPARPGPDSVWGI